MFGLPPLPPYEGLHPLVVHFPIGILLIAWLPMLIALIDKKRRHTWFASAAMLLIVGTTACFAATITGEAADEIIGATTDQVSTAIHEHEETAETARNLFIAATIVFLAVWITGAKISDKKKPMVAVAGGALVVASYVVAALALANAGHLGGLLVHEYGIQAPVNASELPSGAIGNRDDDDD